MSVSRRRIKSFDFQPGDHIAAKYQILAQLGTGWEGEVYLIRELGTRIERTAKFFYPHRNIGDRTIKFYARKLHKLRGCPIVIQYHARDRIEIHDQPVSFLVSEYAHGEILSEFLRYQPGQRLQPFAAMHLLYALAKGIECIHSLGEYHGDLHTDNIIVQRFGLGFELKLVDMFHWGKPSAENIREDVIDLIRIFYDVLGGQRLYAKQPDAVKQICCGLKRSLISRKFRSAAAICAHLERFEW
jgi:tRNA A-37 threonylcarbamoyl transferase component Bud32